MNGKCFEPGTIQAFLDGETTPDVSLRLTEHVAACDNCAQMMAEADEENSLVFAALERELNPLVPTQRLWSRINETIEVEKSRTPLWQKVLVYIRASLANPSVAAAAGIVLVLGMFALVVTVRDRDNTGPSVVQNAPPSSTAQSASIPTVSVATTGDGPAILSGTDSTPAVTISNLKPREIKALAASVRSEQREIKPQTALYTTPAADTYLPGEESYVKTISDLKQNVDTQKDAVMSPSSRISYERDMAMVNDSINRMRTVAKNNPRNQTARQMLYSSYQDKIDLLNSVAQREELMASLR
ncbi:MAG: hypothetical protein ABI857_01525 [Acidobacteriota bacterium]